MKNSTAGRSRHSSGSGSFRNARYVQASLDDVVLPAGGVENGDGRLIIARKNEERLGKNDVVVPDPLLDMFEIGLHMILPGPVLPVRELREDEQSAFAAAPGESPRRPPARRL